MHIKVDHTSDKQWPTLED